MLIAVVGIGFTVEIYILSVPCAYDVGNTCQFVPDAIEPIHKTVIEFIPAKKRWVDDAVYVPFIWFNAIVCPDGAFIVMFTPATFLLI